MIERDYIMRMITMLSAVIAKLLDLKRAKDYPQGLVEIDRACRHILGIDSTLLIAFSDSQLIEFFGSDPEIAAVKWYIIGALLMERAELELLLGEERDSDRENATALSLLVEAYLSAGQAVDAGHTSRIDALIGRTSLTLLPHSIAEKILQYYERKGSYVEAEATMRGILGQNPEFRNEAVKFYERLLSKPDDELAGGNLSRKEITRGLAELARNDSQEQKDDRSDQ